MAKMFIGGESVDSVTKNTTEVRNPATGATVDTVPQGNDKDVQQAIQAAEDAFKVWSDVTPEDRPRAMGPMSVLVVVPFRAVRVEAISLGHQPAEEGLEVGQHGGVGVLLDDQAGRGVA